MESWQPYMAMYIHTHVCIHSTFTHKKVSGSTSLNKMGSLKLELIAMVMRKDRENSSRFEDRERKMAAQASESGLLG